MSIRSPLAWEVQLQDWLDRLEIEIIDRVGRADPGLYEFLEWYSEEARRYGLRVRPGLASLYWEWTSGEFSPADAARCTHPGSKATAGSHREEVCGRFDQARYEQCRDDFADRLSAEELGRSGAQPLAELGRSGAQPLTELGRSGAQPLAELGRSGAQPLAELGRSGAQPLAELDGALYNGRGLMAEFVWWSAGEWLYLDYLVAAICEFREFWAAGGLPEWQSTRRRRMVAAAKESLSAADEGLEKPS